MNHTSKDKLLQALEDAVKKFDAAMIGNSLLKAENKRLYQAFTALSESVQQNAMPSAEDVAEHVCHREIANRLDTGAIAEHFSVSDIAAEVDMTDHYSARMIADEIDAEAVADCMSASDVASYMSHSDVAEHIELDYDTLAEQIDLFALADHMMLRILGSSEFMDRLAEKMNEARAS